MRYLNEKKNGYENKQFTFPTKCYYQTLELKNDILLIEEYIKRHSEKYYWSEIGKGIREVGILNMEMFLLGTKLFMIVETPVDFEWDIAFSLLAKLPRQAEWEAYMSVFQIADPSAGSAEKWQLMERIFLLP